MSWQNASQTCYNYGGALATPHGYTEAYTTIYNDRKTVLGLSGTWIGLKWTGRNFIWESDNTTFLFWSTNQPDNLDDYDDLCVYTTSLYYDSVCSAKLFAACKMSGTYDNAIKFFFFSHSRFF